MLWTFAAGPNGQPPDRDLAGVSNLQVTWQRTGTSTVSFDDPTGEFALEELVDDVLVFCDGQPISRHRAGATSDSGDEKMRVTTSYAATDYRELLRRRDIADDATLSWSSFDPADALWTLISEEAARTGSNLGIVQGAVPSPAVSVASFDAAPGDMVGDTADKLSQLGDGFDWDIVPTGKTGLRLDVWRPRGVDNGIILDYGGNVSQFQRQVDPSAYGNSGRFTGQAPDGGSEPSPLTLDTADIASRPEGRWSYGESTDQTTSAGLAAYGQKSLADRQVVPVTWTVTMRRGAWKGPAYLWLGDPIVWVCRKGRLNVEQPYTVEQIQAGFPTLPNGASTPDPVVSITFGVPPKMRYLSDAQRLSALERR